ncbi:MAG: pyrimidine-nucleoside phosphorylase [Lachnospiraceae bacterium]|nr:pyrimidine-nucleoside phosphorylase [Lachnospiraceae bacterium]
MRMYDLIMKKKHGDVLTEAEIRFFVNGYTKNEIPDYQVSAFLMAVCFNGMNEAETLALTMAMAESGEMLDLSAIHGKKADKHSTGGVGDKTSLILGPMVASLGVPVAKMSGRGLGHTGGTIDKLESFPGFSVSISNEQFVDNVNRMKLAIIGQTADLAPADKKLYALRDVTATVDQLSLIASSIMSKKLAAGSDVIVLDVKAGSGAFMKTYEDARLLAETMVKIGNGAGRKTYAVISDMNQPLGFAVGNILEVKEAIEALNGRAPEDLSDACMTLASYMLLGAERVREVAEAKELLTETVRSGAALHKLAEFVKAQGGDERYVYEPDRFPKASLSFEVKAWADGYLSAMNTEEIGMTSLILGGGRETKESEIDLTVGIVFEKKIGAKLKKGDTVAVLHANDREKLTTAIARLQNAIRIEQAPCEPVPHILGVVEQS